jgi:hypothetical protein
MCLGGDRTGTQDNDRYAEISGDVPAVAELVTAARAYALIALRLL